MGSSRTSTGGSCRSACPSHALWRQPFESSPISASRASRAFTRSVTRSIASPSVRPCEASRLAAEPEKLADGEAREPGRRLGEESDRRRDRASCGDRRRGRRCARCRPTGRSTPASSPHGSGLAGSVAPEKRAQLAALHLERQPIDHGATTETHRETERFDHRPTCPRSGGAMRRMPTPLARSADFPRPGRMPWWRRPAPARGAHLGRTARCSPVKTGS